MKLTYILSLLLYAILASSCQAPDSWELGSKDNNIRFVLKNKPVGTDCQLYYIVYYKDKVAVGESRLGLTMDMHNYGTNAQFISASPVKDISESYQLKAGKRMNTTNDCREQTFTFNSDNDRSFELVVRIYNDGVAFRYNFPDVDNQTYTIQEEYTEFAIPENGKAWIHPYDWNERKKPSYEQYCQNGIPIRSLRFAQ